MSLRFDEVKGWAEAQGFALARRPSGGYDFFQPNDRKTTTERFANLGLVADRLRELKELRDSTWRFCDEVIRATLNTEIVAEDEEEES